MWVQSPPWVLPKGTAVHVIEWVEFNPPIPFGPERVLKDGEYVINSDSFMGRGLVHPGVVLFTGEDKQFLIGDINAEGGIAACCCYSREVGEDTLIKAYAVLKFQVVSK